MQEPIEIEPPVTYSAAGYVIWNGEEVREAMRLSKEDRRALFDAIRAYPAYLDAVITAQAGEHAAARLVGVPAHTYGLWSIVHRSLHGEGKWQHTWFASDDTPCGHTLHATRVAAIKDACEMRMIEIAEVAE